MSMKIRKLKDRTGEVYTPLVSVDSVYDGNTSIKNKLNGAIQGPSSSVDAHVVVFDGTSGKLAKDSGYTIGVSVPSNAEFTDTLYSAGDGLTLTDTTFSNSGVRAVSTGITGGTVSVNTGGNSAEVAVAGWDNKANKVSSPTSGDLASLNSYGDIEDSGISVTEISDALTDISDIQSLIPSQASTSNQLADKAFVSSSISTATATFRGTYNLVTDLSLDPSTATEASTAAAIATYLASLVPPVVADKNDYVFVQVPTSVSTPTEIARVDRYKYDVTAWAFEYSLNNSGFTADQWDALNSGITATREASYQSHINNLDIHVTTSDKSAWNAKYDKPSTGIPSTDMSSAVQTSLGLADTAVQDADIADFLVNDNDLPSTTSVLINADTLNGHADSYFASVEYVNSLVGNIEDFLSNY